MSAPTMIAATTPPPTPRIIVDDLAGAHNRAYQQDADTVISGHSYKDRSTIILVPAIASIPPRIVQSWMSLMLPMNQRSIRLFLEDMEVGDAYTQGIDFILNHPELQNWKYVLTLETDNAPPPDGLLKLIEAMEEGPWAAVGGLYWTKGEGGQPMCYGRSDVHPLNFAPWLPPADTVVECRGLGMGFTLFRTEVFKDARLPKPLFKTVQNYVPNGGAQAYTQDLYGFEAMGKYGYRFACSTKVLVGHWDQREGKMW